MASRFSSDQLLHAWVAGFFDGEGCVMVEYSRSKKSIHGWRTALHATLTQSSTPCLELVQSAFGGSVKTSDVRAAHARRWSVQYTWVVRNEAALTFLRVIAPYTVVKNSQIQLALEYPMFDAEGRKYGGIANPIPEAIWAKRLAIRDGLRDIRAAAKTPAKVVGYGE